MTTTLPPLSKFYTSSSSSGSITCFAHVILPSGNLKTAFYEITIKKPSASVDDFTSILQNALVDDLSESVQIAGGISVMQAALTDYQKSLSIYKVLEGL